MKKQKKENEKTELWEGTTEKRCDTTANRGKKEEKKVGKHKVRIFVVKGSKDKYKVLRRRWEMQVGFGEKSKGKGWII